MSRRGIELPPIPTERLAFYRAIWSNPKDDAPRLVFTDWLEEHGEDEIVRLIRTDVELRRCKDMKRRHSIIMDLFRKRLKYVPPHEEVRLPFPMVTTDMGTFGKILLKLSFWKDDSLAHPEYLKWLEDQFDQLLEVHKVGLLIPSNWLREVLGFQVPIPPESLPSAFYGEWSDPNRPTSSQSSPTPDTESGPG